MSWHRHIQVLLIFLLVVGRLTRIVINCIKKLLIFWLVLKYLWTDQLRQWWPTYSRILDWPVNNLYNEHERLIVTLLSPTWKRLKTLIKITYFATNSPLLCRYFYKLSVIFFIFSLSEKKSGSVYLNLYLINFVNAIQYFQFCVYVYQLSNLIWIHC